MKRIKNNLVGIGSLLLLLSGISSCNKIPARETIMEKAQNLTAQLTGDMPVAYNSVILSADQKISYTDSGFHLTATAVFRDSATGNMLNVAGLSINNQAITRNADSTFSFSYADTTPALLTQGLALAGTTVNITITGTSAADTVTKSIYMPKNILRYVGDFPSENINVLNNQTINWIPDPSNTTGQVIIKVWYTANVSRFLSGDLTLPTTDNTLTYTVADNGSFTIPTADLQVFHANSYIWITMGRGAQVMAVLPVSQKNVYLFTAASGSTNALFVLCAANWQNTSAPLRCTAGSTTGQQQQQQQDISPCSSTYNQTQWVDAGTNLTACPACNSSNCSGNSHKCISGSCQTGTLEIISRVQSGTKCITNWGYFFSDGTDIFDHSTSATGTCEQ